MHTVCRLSEAIDSRYADLMGRCGLVVKASGWPSLDRRTLHPRVYGGALVVWPGMPFQIFDGRLHHLPVLMHTYFVFWRLFADLMHTNSVL